jgi:glutathione S-transferase
MRLLGRLSSINVRKVAWTCDEIGLRFTREDWGAGFRSTRDPEFLALNPNGLVPVIEDENGVLWGSNTICRYLAAKAGRDDLWPSHPRRRALVDQWMDWQALELNGSWTYAFSGLVRENPAFQDPAEIAKSLAAWDSMMELLDTHLAENGPYMCGEEFTLADIVIGLSVHRWRMTPHAMPDLGSVLEYYELLCHRADFMEYGPNGGP